MDEQQAIHYGGEQQELESELDQQPQAYELLEPGNYGNSGLRALAAVARHFRLDWSLPRLLHVYGRQGEPSSEQLARAAQKEGLKAAVHRIEWERLQKFERLAPFLARLKTGGYVVVVRTPGQVGQGGPAVQSDAIMVVNPSRPEAGLFSVKQEDFLRYWTGEVLFLKRLHKVTDTDRRFGLGWFVPELWRQRGLLKNIVVAALAMHVLALAVPIFFQVVIDRVLVYQNVSTLVVITAGVIAAVLFDSTLSWLRGYFVLRAASRIDIRLARKTFAHLMGLPIGFFEASLAGVVTKHMQQASQIREFLTGRLLGTLLDLPALLVFLPLMAWYSGTLTFVVVAVTAALALIIWSMIGPYRRRLRRLYEAEASRQSLLVETVHGMRTIKTLNLEPRRQESWENAAADAVHNYVEVGNLSLAANTVSQFTDRALTIIIVVIGAYLVFGGSLSVGALVAFNMLATRVVGPVLQLIGLLNHYQEVTMSVEMLGEIMNRPTEGGNRRGLMPPLRGDIDIEQVTFRYPGTETPALRNVSVHIPAGKLVAIVGRSGSGKTTLSALLQGLYWAGEGAIKVDGHNIQDLDMTYLRGMSGAVPQEPFLFRGTVKENIRVGNPTATFEEVVNAARIAGADEFVQRLPRRYDTLLEEGAVNLSGGQKQRLSIARALLRNPKIIIFDEATSALDPESENVVVRNLRGIAAGRTTILISHRLRTISGADSIIVMDDGRIDAVGTHAQLLEASAVYNTLWTQQTEAAT